MPTFLQHGKPLSGNIGNEDNSSNAGNAGNAVITVTDNTALNEMNLSQILKQTQLGRMDLKQIRQADLTNLQRLLTPRMNKYIPHVPTAKQAAFLLLDGKEAFYGGAAGGGKSDALLMGGLQYVDVRGYAGIIFRKTYADLTKPGALIDRAKDWLFRFDDVRWNEKDKKFEFFEKVGPHKETISILQFGYLENSNDKYNYQGGEYQFIGFDELTHIDKDSYTYMFSRLRRLKNTYIPLRVRGASNPPDDDSGIWVKERFIDEGPAKGRVFIPAGMDDNPYLDVTAYEDSLNELDPVTRARLRDGNWEIIRKGNMFKRDWFQPVTELPMYRKRVRFWDMAATDEEKAKRRNKSNDPDYTVGFLLSEFQGTYYIEDIIRVRKSAADTEQLQKGTALADGYHTIVREEREPGSSGIAVIDNKKRTLMVGFDYDENHSTGTKTARALAVSAAAERGQVKYLQGCRNIEAFFGEAESFPGGIHDDMVDGLSGAFNLLSSVPTYGQPIVVEKAEEKASLWSGVEDLGSGYFTVDFNRLR